MQKRDKNLNTLEFPEGIEEGDRIMALDKERQPVELGVFSAPEISRGEFRVEISLKRGELIGTAVLPASSLILRDAKKNINDTNKTID